ncbi:MAG: MarR family transcriptional regulator [Actinomycetota bacterium]|nr:MarR family transcriptional regulator [Actinomycetota bacterium]
MIVPLEAAFLVLHALRLKGRATTASVATATGLSASEVDDVFAGLSRDGLVERPTAASGAWALTAAGRDGHRGSLEAEGRRDRAAREAMYTSYRRFLSLNQPFKQLCTDWQLRGDGAPKFNDHTDTTYDRNVIDRLIHMHRDTLDVVDELARAAPRFGPYRERFEAAVHRLQAGDLAAFTTPLADSYHDVWMELHEDLLVTLGLPRREGET